MRSALHSVKLVAALVAATSAAAQQPFDLDPSFETQLIQEYVSSALVVEDGKLLVSGRIVFQGNSTFIPNAGALLNADGSRDLLFQEYPEMSGRITLFGAQFYCSGGQTVRRLNMDGTVDPSFIHMNAGPYFSSLQGGDYHVFPDGRVLMTGTHQLNDPARGYVGYYRLIWFSNTGYLDTTRVHRQANANISLIREELNGRFLCSGTMTSYEGSPVSVVFRIETDGSLDPTYSSPIQSIPTTSGGFRNVVEIEPLSDGRALVGGFWHLAGGNDTIAVMRLMPDGSQDATFDPVPVSASGAFTNWIFPQCMDILPLPDGRMIITGNFDHVRGVPRGGIALINADGSLSDDYFAGPGCGDYSGIEVNYRYIAGIVPAPNGEYYIHGAYVGYDDGTNNYPQQAFVSRLHGLNVGIGERAPIHVEVFPNPSVGHVTIQLDRCTGAEELEVCDALGRMVLQQRITGASMVLDLSQQADGLYTLAVRSKGRAPVVQRVVIQH
ncbi:MAG: T9SS type A sorting domain-containing protein [Flavobacteriales bacterium]|nr:T9SS type A sorting domain-containing protein [Flavobacteriales bacterium]